MRWGSRGPAWSRGVLLFLTSQGLTNVSLGVFGVLYNLVLAAQGLSLAFIGAFNAVSILAVGVSAVPLGFSARWLSHRQLLITGTLLLIAVQAVLARGASPALLMGASAVWGVAQALCLVPMGPFLSEQVSPDERARAFGVLFAVLAAAGVVGSVLGGVLPGMLGALALPGGAEGSGAERGALLVADLLAVLGLPPLLLLPRGRRSRGGEEAEEGWQAGRAWALRTVPRTAGTIVATIALYSLASGLVAPFFNVYFVQTQHLTTAFVGTLFALAALASVPGSLLGPRLSSRLGSVGALGLTRLAIVPCLVALALGTHAALLAMAGFMGRYVLINVSGAIDYHFSMAAVPGRARLAVAGLRSGTFNTCWAAGAWGAGLVLDRTGYAPIFLISAALTALSAGLALALFSTLPFPLRRRVHALAPAHQDGRRAGH